MYKRERNKLFRRRKKASINHVGFSVDLRRPRWPRRPRRPRRPLRRDALFGIRTASAACCFHRLSVARHRAPAAPLAVWTTGTFSSLDAFGFPVCMYRLGPLVVSRSGAEATSLPPNPASFLTSNKCSISFLKPPQSEATEHFLDVSCVLSVGRTPGWTVLPPRRLSSTLSQIFCGSVGKD